jgi:tetratricopeptide (TPR) repeat protein
VAYGAAATLLADAERSYAAGNWPAVVARFRAAAAAEPFRTDILHWLATAACRSADFALAASTAEQILRIDPHDLGAWLLLSGLLAQADRLPEALEACERAIAIDPLRPESHMECAGLHARRGDFVAVARCCRQVVALRPNWTDAHVNLGAALFRQSQPQEAAACFRRALVLQPDHAHAWRNLAAAQRALGNFDGALTAYRKARDIAPDFAEAWRDEALMHLMLGDFATGWTLYEWRWRAPLPGAPALPGRAWDGAPLPGTLLLHCEQGLGDTIQFLRYVPMVAARVGHLVLCVPGTLRQLAETVDADIEVVEPGEALPHYDRYTYLMSLPRLFGTTVETIPPSPYLHTTPARSSVWRPRLAALSSPRIGLVWVGSTAHEADAQRSIPPETLDPLLHIDGITFVGLQYPQPRNRPTGLAVDLAPAIADMADTAAILQEIDLLITVDTAAAHLAGALGRPAWVLLAEVGDWRWLTGRTDSPWYSSLRLFRQRPRGDWKEVVERVGGALRQWMTTR